MLKKTINLFERKKKHKIGKTFKIITQQTRLTEKFLAIEHPKTSHKLSKTIRHAKKFSQIVCAGKNFTRPLYNEATKHENFLEKRSKNNETMSCLES